MNRHDKDAAVLGLIPARGGSKGIPRKNLAPLGGKPLIAHTIEAARASGRLADYIVSTDDEEIARVARLYGAAVPFLRPPELADDTAKAQDVAAHALNTYDPVHRFTHVLLLQPTTPFRTNEDIDNAIALAASRRADCVVSFTRAETHHPYYMYFVDQAQEEEEPPRVRQAFDYPVGMRRQDFPPAAYRNGAIYLTRIAYFKKHRSFVSKDVVPYFMTPERSVNVDTPEDIAYAEFLFSRKSKEHSS